MSSLLELLNYRQMIFSLTKKDLRGRYKGSVLGFFWTFLNPLLQLTVYTIVFSMILRSDIDQYYIFLFVGLIPWIFFASSVTGGASCILASKDMVKKIYFPREVLPISFVLSQFVNMLLSFLVVFAVLIVTGFGIRLRCLIYLPLIMIVELLLALGIALLVSAITVYLRDLEYILGIVVMAWQFLTPVMYSIEIVPERWRVIFIWNPMTSIINAYRSILYDKQVPQFETLTQAALMGVFFCIVGYFIFRVLQKRFAEEL